MIEIVIDQGNVIDRVIVISTEIVEVVKDPKKKDMIKNQDHDREEDMVGIMIGNVIEIVIEIAIDKGIGID